MAARIEQARGFNTSLVLAPQVVAGMGDEQEAARILGSVETVICHRVNTPEEIIALAGTRKTMEYSTHYATEGATGDGSARIQHQFKIDPNKVRALPPGARVCHQPRASDEDPGAPGTRHNWRAAWAGEVEGEPRTNRSRQRYLGRNQHASVLGALGDDRIDPCSIAQRWQRNLGSAYLVFAAAHSANSATSPSLY